jgi:hypothetical protein
MIRSVIHATYRHLALTAACASMLGVCGLALAQTNPAPQAPAPDRQADNPEGDQARRPRQPLSREELRARFRQFLDARAAQLRRDQEELDRAIKMLDEGKTLDEIRAAFPDRPRTGQNGAGGFGQRRGVSDWLQRIEMGEMPGDVTGGTGRGRSDSDVLGEPPGGPMGGPKGRGNSDDNPDRAGPGPDRTAGPGPQPGRTDINAPLTQEERETIRDFIRSTAPHMLSQMDELEKTRPQEVEQKYRRMLRLTRNLLDLRQHDKVLYDLRLQDIKVGREALDAAREIAQLQKKGIATSDPKYEQASQRLRTALQAQFTVRGEAMRHEAEKARERLTHSDQELASREANRDKVINDLMTRMIEKERRWVEHPDERREPGPQSD